MSRRQDKGTLLSFLPCFIHSFYLWEALNTKRGVTTSRCSSHAIMQVWSHSGHNNSIKTYPFSCSCPWSKVLLKRKVNMTTEEWYGNVLLFKMGSKFSPKYSLVYCHILYTCRSIFLKYCLTHHKLKLSSLWKYNFFSNSTHEEPKYIFQIKLSVLESKHQSSLQSIVKTGIN